MEGSERDLRRCLEFSSGGPLQLPTIKSVSCAVDPPPTTQDNYTTEVSIHPSPSRMEAQTDATPEKGRSPHSIPAFIGPLVQSRHTTPCPTYFEVSFLESKVCDWIGYSCAVCRSLCTLRAMLSLWVRVIAWMWDSSFISSSHIHAVLTDGYRLCTHVHLHQRKRTQRLDAIVFRNFYCSHITIKRRRQRVDPETAATSTAAAGSGTDGDPWVTILRDRSLMESPHHEDDAQYWHVVTADEFDREEYDAESTAPLRSASPADSSGTKCSYRLFLTLLSTQVCLTVHSAPPPSTLNACVPAVHSIGRIYLYQSSPMWKTIGLHHVKVTSWSSSGGSNGAEEDASTVRDSGRRETDGHLGDLCKGISEQVEIFGDKRRLRQMS